MSRPQPVILSCKGALGRENLEIQRQQRLNTTIGGKRNAKLKLSAPPSVLRMVVLDIVS